MPTQTFTDRLYVQTCIFCGVAFGMPDDLDKERRRDGRNFHCPNGHAQAYTKTVEQRLRAEVARLEGAVAAARASRDSARRSRAAVAGHLTRMRNRVAAGVCPVPGCRRTGLTQTVRHIASKHPGWFAEHSHELDKEPVG